MKGSYKGSHKITDRIITICYSNIYRYSKGIVRALRFSAEASEALA